MTVGLTGAAVQPVADGWWDSFQDPQLDRLIRLGLKDSPTLGAGAGASGEALAQAQTAQAGLLPNANLDASALYQRAPENYLIPPPLAGHSFWMGQAGASLGWDLDFWGRQADAVHRAQDSCSSRRSSMWTMRDSCSPAPSRKPMSSCTANTRSRTSPSAPRRSARTSSTSRAAASRPGSIRSSRLREAEGQLPQARVARDQAQAAADLAVHELAT